MKTVKFIFAIAIVLISLSACSNDEANDEAALYDQDELAIGDEGSATIIRRTGNETPSGN